MDLIKPLDGGPGNNMQKAPALWVVAIYQIYAAGGVGGSVTANIGWYVVSEKWHHFWELP